MKRESEKQRNCTKSQNLDTKERTRMSSSTEDGFQNFQDENFEDEPSSQPPSGGITSPSRSERSSSTGSSSQLSLSEAVVKAIFLLLGVGILIPWNAFISAKPYFQARFCNDEGKVIVNFELWFGLIWNMSSVLSLGLIIAGQSISDYCKKRRENRSHIADSSAIIVTAAGGNEPLNLSPSTDYVVSQQHHETHDHSFWLVMVPLALYMSVFVATDLLVVVPSMEPKTFLVVTLVGLGLCGTCGAIATAGIVATAGLFPSHIGINPFFSGQALGGVAVSVANFIAASLEDPTSFWDQTCESRIEESFQRTTPAESIDFRYLDDQQPECKPYSVYDWAVFAYFLAGCIVLALCLLGYSNIHKYQESEHRDDYEVVHDNDNVHIPVVYTDESPRIGLEMNERILARKEDNTLASLPESSSYHDEIHNADPLARESLSDGDRVTLEGRADPIITTNDGDNDDEYTDEENEVAVFAAIKGPFVCIFLTFTVTLSLFPSWVSQLRSSHECQSHFRLFNDLYVPANFVLFNVGDLLGRIMSEKVPVGRISHMSLKLNLVAISRVIFLPLLLLCVNENSSGRKEIESDIYSILVLFVFAFTNGILVSCSFMHGPHLVSHTTGMQERASEMLTFAVFFGLLSGSMLSFPVSRLASLL